MRTTWSRLEKALDCGGNPIGLSENAMVDIMDITYILCYMVVIPSYGNHHALHIFPICH